ncbi:hypothetical protein [Nocardioides ferulae]|uniref:hypothetical protein n=1 Tax=Nocardioides ferulae TaxID=2340821 RepID=UPI000EB35DD7|nr:hypothetical protein [Nocardioides ferulae]
MTTTTTSPVTLLAVSRALSLAATIAVGVAALATVPAASATADLPPTMVVEQDPYWGDLNPDGYARTAPVVDASDPYWTAPAAGGPAYGYLHLADLDFWADQVDDLPATETLPVHEKVDERFLRWADQGATANGAWAARAVVRIENIMLDNPVRSMEWRRVNFGAWCTTSTEVVGWNQHLDTWTCLPNRTALEAQRPGYAVAKEACVAANASRGSKATGYEPTWTGSTWSASGCTDKYLDPATAPAPQTQTPALLKDYGDRWAGRCAPWEDLRRSPTTSLPYCDYQFYSWIKGQNHPEGGFFPPNGEPFADPIPGMATVHASALGKAKVRDQVLATATRTATVRRDTVKTTVRRTIRGTRYTATAKAPVTVSATATAEKDYGAQYLASVTWSAQCSKPTMSEARRCAEQEAQRLADAEAQRQVEEERRLGHDAMVSAAQGYAASLALHKAERIAERVRVPASAYTKAKAKATRKALKKIRAMAR